MPFSPPAAFIGEFDEEAGATMSYVSELYGSCTSGDRDWSMPSGTSMDRVYGSSAMHHSGVAESENARGPPLLFPFIMHHFSPFTLPSSTQSSRPPVKGGKSSSPSIPSGLESVLPHDTETCESPSSFCRCSTSSSIPTVQPVGLTYACGNALISKDVVTANAIQPQYQEFCQHIASRVLKETMGMHSEKKIYFCEPGLPAVAGISFRLVDVQGRGRRRQFCVVFTHPSPEALLAAWPDLYARMVPCIQRWEQHCEARSHGEHGTASHMARTDIGLPRSSSSSSLLPYSTSHAMSDGEGRPPPPPPPLSNRLDASIPMQNGGGVKDGANASVSTTLPPLRRLGLLLSPFRTAGITVGHEGTLEDQEMYGLWELHAVFRSLLRRAFIPPSFFSFAYMPTHVKNGTENSKKNKKMRDGHDDTKEIIKKEVDGEEDNGTHHVDPTSLSPSPPLSPSTPNASLPLSAVGSSASQRHRKTSTPNDAIRRTQQEARATRECRKEKVWAVLLQVGIHMNTPILYPSVSSSSSPFSEASCAFPSSSLVSCFLLSMWLLPYLFDTSSFSSSSFPLATTHLGRNDGDSSHRPTLPFNEGGEGGPLIRATKEGVYSTDPPPERPQWAASRPYRRESLLLLFSCLFSGTPIRLGAAPLHGRERSDDHVRRHACSTDGAAKEAKKTTEPKTAEKNRPCRCVPSPDTIHFWLALVRLFPRGFLSTCCCCGDGCVVDGARLSCSFGSNGRNAVEEEEKPRTPLAMVEEEEDLDHCPVMGERRGEASQNDGEEVKKKERKKSRRMVRSPYVLYVAVGSGRVQEISMIGTANRKGMMEPVVVPNTTSSSSSFLPSPPPPPPHSTHENEFQRKESDERGEIPPRKTNVETNVYAFSSSFVDFHALPSFLHTPSTLAVKLVKILDECGEEQMEIWIKGRRPPGPNPFLPPSPTAHAKRLPSSLPPSLYAPLSQTGEGFEEEKKTARGHLSSFPPEESVRLPPPLPTTTTTTSTMRDSEANTHTEAPAEVDEVEAAATTSTVAPYFAALLYKIHIAMDVIVTEYMTKASAVTMNIWKREETLGRENPFHALLVWPRPRRKMQEQLLLLLSSFALREEATHGSEEEEKEKIPCVCYPSEGTAATPISSHVSSVRCVPLCASGGRVVEERNYTHTSVERMSAVDRQTFLFLHAYSFF